MTQDRKNEKTVVETAPDLSDEDRAFIEESERAIAAAEKHGKEHGPDPIFQTKRWREKTGFPIGIVLEDE